MVNSEHESDADQNKMKFEPSQPHRVVRSDKVEFGFLEWIFQIRLI